MNNIYKMLLLACAVLLYNANAEKAEYGPLKEGEFCEVDFKEIFKENFIGKHRYCVPCPPNSVNEYPEHQQRCLRIGEDSNDTETDDHAEPIPSTPTRSSLHQTKTEVNNDPEAPNFNTTTQHTTTKPRPDKDIHLEADDQKASHPSTEIYTSTPSSPDQNVENRDEQKPLFNTHTLVIAFIDILNLPLWVVLIALEDIPCKLFMASAVSITIYLCMLFERLAVGDIFHSIMLFIAIAVDIISLAIAVDIISLAIAGFSYCRKKKQGELKDRPTEDVEMGPTKKKKNQEEQNLP